MEQSFSESPPGTVVQGTLTEHRVLGLLRGSGETGTGAEPSASRHSAVHR